MLDQRTAAAFAAPDRAVLDVCGRRRSPATFPEFHKGRKPKNAGQRYPQEVPSVSEIVAVMNGCPDTLSGRRTRALILIMWRTGVRISEALDLHEQDLNEHDKTVFVRCGKGSKARLIGMDAWGFSSYSRGSRYAAPCQSGRCSPSCSERPPVVGGRHPVHARQSVPRRSAPVFVSASTHTRSEPRLPSNLTVNMSV